MAIEIKTRIGINFAVSCVTGSFSAPRADCHKVNSVPMPFIRLDVLRIRIRAPSFRSIAAVDAVGTVRPHHTTKIIGRNNSRKLLRRVFSKRACTKFILIIFSTSSSHHLTYTIILYINIIYINIVYLIIYITYIIYIIYVIYIIIIYIIIHMNIMYIMDIVIYMYIIYISIMYIFQQFIGRRKGLPRTPTKNSDNKFLQLFHSGLESGVNTHAKNSY